MLMLFIRTFHIEIKLMLIIWFNICDAGKQVGGTQLGSSICIILFCSYNVKYDVVYNMFDYVCLNDIDHCGLLF